MADNPTQSSPSRGNASAQVAGNDTIDAMEKQLSQLRREITKINRTLADRAEEVVDEAAGWYDTASEGASVATRALRSQAEKITQVTRQNPATIFSAILAGGVLGLLIGMTLASPPARR